MKIGYARVSTEDQNLNLQLDALNQYGCDVIYQDFGVSGSKTSRPELDKCLDSLKPGDTLVVWKFDRLGRKAAHLTPLIDELLKRGIYFVSLTQGFDTSTPSGKFMSTIMAATAEYERDVLIERVKAGMRAAKDRGVQIGAVPKYTDRIPEVRKLHAEGKTTRDIALTTGIPKSTVARLVVAQ
jgi:DNA invertase Pin-like site-specific DNA recombinase